MNKILKLSFQNRKYLALVSLAGLCLFLIPLHFVGADDSPDLAKCDWNTPWYCFAAVVHYLITFPIRIAAIQIAIPLAIIALVSGIGYTIVTILLGWIKTIALNVPVIPDKVGVVRAGFDITQNLANILLILVLVFIGLATILRIKDYEAKKLLPILIIVALLINFSPVLVGFVVDISNIITNFFLNMGSFEYTASIWQMIGNYFLSVFSILTQMGAIWDVIGYIVGITILGIVIIAFFTYASWIYLMIVRILIVRIIALWILMILAPIAFLFYILPATRGLATKWWKTLIQWAMLGIPIGFFLFLSFKILQDTVQIESFFHTANLSGKVQSADYGIGLQSASEFNARLGESFGMMLTPLVSLIMLHIGYKLSRSYMPDFANKMITKSEQMVKKGAKIAGMVGLAVATAGVGAAVGGAAASAGAGLAKASAGKGLLGAGMRVAGTKLMGYGEKMKKIGLPSGFKDWDATSQEAFIKPLNNREILVASAAAKDNQQFFSKDTRDRISEATHAAYGLDKKAIDKGKVYSDTELEQSKEDTNYVKYASQAAKYSPDELSEPLRLKMKMAGKSGADRMEALASAKEDIDETEKFIRDNVSDEDLTIEAGIRFKYITRADVKNNRANALQTAQQELIRKPWEKDQFVRDAAAGANFVREFKGSDIGNIINTKNLATRTGIILGNPSNLQRIADEHGQGALEDVITGKGGLNDATNDFDKIKEFRKRSPKMFKGLFTNPALQYIDIEARNQMVDVHGQRTDNYNAFERTLRIEDELEKASPLIQNFNGLHVKYREIEQQIKDHRLRGKPTASLEAQQDDIIQDIAIAHARIERIKDDREEWERIEGLRTASKKKKQSGPF